MTCLTASHRAKTTFPACSPGRARCALIVLTLIFASRVCNAAETLSQIAESKAERFVAASLREDGEADLAKLPESQRIIRAEFLQKILFATDVIDIRGSEVSISGATVKGALYPPKSQWNMGKGSTVTRHVSLKDCHFDLVSLNGVNFENGFVVESSDFEALVLGGIHLKGRMILQKITIRPFSDAHSPGSLGVLISGNIEGTLQVQDISPLLNAGGLTATHVQVLQLDADAPDVYLARLQTEDLFLLGLGKPGEHPSLGVLSLTGASVKNSVDIEAVDVRDLMDLSWASVANLQWVVPACDGQREGICWPKKMLIAGMSFRELNMAQAKADPVPGEKRSYASTAVQSDPRLALEFLHRADFSEPAYASYSQFLRSRGLVAAADDAQLAMHAHKRRARWEEAGGFFSDLGATVFVAIDLAQLIFLGYGQSALPPLVWALAFVLFGMVVFRKQERMEVVGDHPPRFSAFWYSLELFLPVVDLGVAKSWRPSQKSRPLLTYARIHQLAGWILIPVALAALTGVFK